MASSQDNNYSTLQSQLQSAEKHYQNRAYALSEAVQKANKAYQKKLADVDKAYKKAEADHTKAKQALAKKYAAETKALTQKGIENTQKKEASVKTYKARWSSQQKTIKEGFKDSLDVKKQELAAIEKEKKAQEKVLDDEYQKAKAQLQSIKTETTEIFLNAQEPFNNSLKYYIKRLKDAAKDDQKYLKQELTALSKDLSALEKKESQILKALDAKTHDRKERLSAHLDDYSKDLKAIAAKIKSVFTRSTKKIDASIESFNDSIKSGVRTIKATQKKIETRIEQLDAQEKAFIDAPGVTLDTPTLKLIVKDLTQTNDLRHDAYQEMYQSLFGFMDELTGYVRTLRDDYKSTVHGLMDQHLSVYTRLMDEAQLLLDTQAWEDAPQKMAQHLRVGALKSELIKHVESLLAPFVSMQKKWHASMLRVYKESTDIYQELDEIQAFFDAFDEEKALAFENEQIHVSKKSAQLTIEIDTAKKRYEVDMLDADQSVLFEEKKRDYLEKVAGAEKRLELSRHKADFDAKKKASQKIIDEAKAEFDLKKTYYATEKSLLKDKHAYLEAREKEAYELKRLENEKAKDNALHAMKVQQAAELDAHDMRIRKAQNELSQRKEAKRQLEQDFHQANAADQQAALLKLKQEKDAIDLEIKRIDFEEDTEFRDIETAKNNEIMVPKNRLKEFDKALKRRYQSINKPYKALLKTFDQLSMLLEDPAISYDKVVAVASPEFKDAIAATLEGDYETLRWTREYYSELEVSRIKRSGISQRKQTAEIRRHEQSEQKYLESLDVYLKDTKLEVSGIFERFHSKIDSRSLLKPKELIRHAKQLYDDALALVESQTNSVLNEIQSLFDYIREQDEAFIQEIEHGAEYARASIKAKYDEKRAVYLDQTADVDARISALKNAPTRQLDEAQQASLSERDEQINAQQERIQTLEHERLQIVERFKTDQKTLDNDYQQKLDQIQFEEVRRLDDLSAEMQQEAERIEAKLEQAKQILAAIKSTENDTIDHHKQVYEYQAATAERAYEDKVRKLDEGIEEAKREQARKKIEIERTLNASIDTIQKEIASKETQLDAALEKVNREYDTLYFDKQTRMQHLNERLESLRKKLIHSKEDYLDAFKDDLATVPSLDDAIQVKANASEAVKAFAAHRDEISRWIDEKKRSFQESL